MGADGIIFGAAIALAGSLVHPSTVCVTVYSPPAVTVIAGVVSPVLHNKLPVKSPAVNFELPQLSTTVMVGEATDEIIGAAITLPGSLVQPFTVCVKVYVPPVVTVIDVVVSPVLHSNDPVNDPAVKTEWPQLFATVTVGAGGIIFGEAVALPSALTHSLTVCVTV
jgi:hypothetical protein